jgi:hypothetical protein
VEQVVEEMVMEVQVLAVLVDLENLQVLLQVVIQ